jgi:catechol 2,3-dioxygenase-like lactoylglutathione lyase family enzyme
MAQTGTETQISDVHTITVPVANQERALGFYVEKLGFEKRLDVSYGDGQRWIEVAPAGAGTTIALPPPGGSVKPGVDTGIRLSTRDAEADHGRLRERGVDVDTEVLRFGEGVPPMFSLRDPDGNTLYVVEEMPGG